MRVSKFKHGEKVCWDYISNTECECCGQYNAKVREVELTTVLEHVEWLKSPYKIENGNWVKEEHLHSTEAEALKYLEVHKNLEVPGLCENCQKTVLPLREEVQKLEETLELVCEELVRSEFSKTYNGHETSMINHFEIRVRDAARSAKNSFIKKVEDSIKSGLREGSKCMSKR